MKRHDHRPPGLAARQPAAAGASWWSRAWFKALLLVVGVIAAYLPVWHAGFIWDDDAYLLDNHTLRSLGGLAQIWGNLTATPQYYPLVHTSFWLEYRFWGLHPLGYHVSNVLLHALASLLLWRLLVRLRIPGAWLAAGIFALHPVAVESVAWVTERKNVLSAVFYFAAALAYLRWTAVGESAIGHPQPARRWYVIALALFTAALLSKTVTCSLPAALLLIFWWKRGRICLRDVWPLVPFFVIGIALGLVTSWLERTHVGATGPDWELSLLQRLLLAGRAVWFYAGKLTWPANLTFIYPRWGLNPAIWWQWAFPVAAATVVLVLWILRQRIGRGPLVAVLFFGGTLFPALGFANVYPMRYSFVADHFQYLASVGLIVLAAAGLVRIPWRIQFAAVVLLLGLGMLTWEQSHIYKDKQTLWRDTLAKNPACWMAHNNLGIILRRDGQVNEAIGHYREALRLNPDYAEAHNNLGNALADLGQAEEAIRSFREAIRSNPNYALAYNGLGTALYRLGRDDEAIPQFQNALQLQPLFAFAHLNLGNALRRSGRLDDAIRAYQAGLKLKPAEAEAQYNLAALLLGKGRLAEAHVHAREALRLQPGSPEAHQLLASICQKQNRPLEASSEYEAALRLAPDWPEVQNNLAWLLATHPDADVRDGPRAVSLAERACSLTQHTNRWLLSTLAAAYAEAGRFANAVATQQKACELAAAQGRTNEAQAFHSRLELYRSGYAYRRP